MNDYQLKEIFFFEKLINYWEKPMLTSFYRRKRFVDKKKNTFLFPDNDV